MGLNIEVAFGGKREEARPRVDRPLWQSWSHQREGKGGSKYSSGRSLDSVRQGGRNLYNYERYARMYVSKYVVLYM